MPLIKFLADTNIVFGGVIDPFFASGGYFTGNQYLIFDAFIESKIVSAVIIHKHIVQ